MSFLRTQWLNVVLCAFVVLLPWQTRYIFSDGSTSIYVGQIILGLLLVIGYFSFGKPQIRSEYRTVIFFVLGFIAFVTLSSTWSLVPLLTLFQGIHLAFAGLFLIALLDSRVNLKIIAYAFALGLIPSVLLGAFQVFSGGSPASTFFGLAVRDAQHLGDIVTVIHGERILRAYGSFPHPNIFGGYLAIGILAAVYTWKDWKRSGVLVAMLSIGLLLTQSRSAVLGLFLGLGIMFVSKRIRSADLARKIVLPLSLGALALAVAVTVFAPAMVSAIRGGGALEERSIEERQDQYADFPSVMRGADWIIGNGAGAYAAALRESHPGRDVWAYQPIHNVALLLVGELGIGGILFVLYGFSLVWRPATAHPSFIPLVCLINLLTISFFDHYLWSSWSGLALVALVTAFSVRDSALDGDTAPF
jgi:O-antigen ligase